MRDSETMVPSVGTSGVNEWPAPTARIGPLAAAMCSCSSATEAGATRAAGKHCCEPDQLRQGKRRSGFEAAGDVPFCWARSFTPAAAATSAASMPRRLSTALLACRHEAGEGLELGGITIHAQPEGRHAAKAIHDAVHQ